MSLACQFASVLHTHHATAVTLWALQSSGTPGTVQDHVPLIPLTSLQAWHSSI